MTVNEILSATLQLLLLITTVAAVVAYFRQHKTMQQQFNAMQKQLSLMRESREGSLIVQRRDLYYKTTSLSDEDVKTMMLHVRDHFDYDVYLDRYAGNHLRIKSYLLMKRKYIYLLLTTHFQTSKSDPAREAPQRWLEELCKYREFQDVHASQGKYYPAFERLVNETLGARSLDQLFWACDDPARDAGNA